MKLFPMHAEDILDKSAALASPTGFQAERKVVLKLQSDGKFSQDSKMNE